MYGLIVGTIFFGVLSAFPLGPPVVQYPGICDTMMPNHSANAMDLASCPFELYINSEGCYKKGQSVQVVIREKKDIKTDHEIEGLFVMMRPKSSVGAGAGKAVGTWAPHNNADVLKPLKCHNKEKSAIGHKKEEEAHFRTMKWTPSDDYGDVEAFATIVAGKSKFWVKVKGTKVLKLSTSCNVEADETGSHSARTLPTISLMLTSIIMIIATKVLL